MLDRDQTVSLSQPEPLPFAYNQPMDATPPLEENRNFRISSDEPNGIHKKMKLLEPSQSAQTTKASLSFNSKRISKPGSDMKKKRAKIRKDERSDAASEGEERNHEEPVIQIPEMIKTALKPPETVVNPEQIVESKPTAEPLAQPLPEKKAAARATKTAAAKDKSDKYYKQFDFFFNRSVFRTMTEFFKEKFNKYFSEYLLDLKKQDQKAWQQR